MPLQLSRSSINNGIFGVGAVVLSGALLRIFSSGESDLVSTGDRRFEIILAVLYLIVFVMAVTRLRGMLRMLLRTPALIGLLLLPCFSPLWAELPGLVVRRTAGVLGATLFGLALASYLAIADELKLLRRIFRIVATLSMTASVLLILTGANIFARAGQSGLADVDGGAATGIFNHKNLLGATMALAILVEWHLPVHHVRSLISKALWMCCYAVLLLLSNSVTSVVSVVLTIVAMYMVKTLRCQYRLLMPMSFLALLFSAAFFLLNPGAITGALGRSSDLTGRVDLWRWVAVMILKRPLFGYGFSGFWRGASEQSFVVENHIGWSPVYSHNGYLEILLSLGLAGLVFFLWFAMTGLRGAAIQAKAGRSIRDLWPLAFLIFFLIHNLGECTILWQNSLEWALCVATVARLHAPLGRSMEAVHSQGDILVKQTPEYA